MRSKLAVAAIAGCPVFPASSPWNQRVDGLPVHPRSDAMVQAIGTDETVHPDFGSGTYEGRPIGIPYQVVSKSQRRAKVTFEYADESDRGPYPIPRKPRIEGGGDRHVLLVQRGTCRLFELFAAEKRGGRWHAGSGAIFDLRSNRLRPEGWTSADAAGLPILAGLARYDEVAKGEIRHALRFTVSGERRPVVLTARHFASTLTDPDLPAMGQRLRLKATVDVSRMPKQARVVATALQRYGMLVADNGSDWYISGAPHPKWDNDALRALKGLEGSDFEVVSEPR